MKTKKMIKRIKKAIKEKLLCYCVFEYDRYYDHCFPVKLSDKLFIAFKEYDFMLNGYSICRIKDLCKVQIAEGIYMKVNKAEGVTNQLYTPDVNIKNWKTVFIDLQKQDKCIIVEHEDIKVSKYYFINGKVEKVLDKKVFLREFDADGKWYDNLVEVPYKDITSIIVDSRYTEVFSKYLPTYPEMDEEVSEETESKDVMEEAQECPEKEVSEEKQEVSEEQESSEAENV